MSVPLASLLAATKVTHSTADPQMPGRSRCCAVAQSGERHALFCSPRRQGGRGSIYRAGRRKGGDCDRLRKLPWRPARNLFILVPDARAAMADMAAAFYGRPADAA